MGTESDETKGIRRNQPGTKRAVSRGMWHGYYALYVPTFFYLIERRQGRAYRATSYLTYNISDHVVWSATRVPFQISQQFRNIKGSLESDSEQKRISTGARNRRCA